MRIEVREYIENGRSPFSEWFSDLDAGIAARVDRSIRRLETGNFGAAKVLGDGVSELRLDFGPGYRVYYGLDGKTLVILLAGGDNPQILPQPWRDEKGTRRQNDMALTKTYKATVLARIQRDPKFARALYVEALNALIEGEVAAGLSMLRDLVHARITFKTLATETGFGEKALHRMLSKRGNPRSQNLFTITRAIREELGVIPHVSVHV